MPSFDVVSEVNQHELSNALDQANREIGTRYDFKGSDARIEQVRSADEFVELACQQHGHVHPQAARRTIPAAELCVDDAANARPGSRR